MSVRKKNTWKSITKQPLGPSIESIRNQFGIGAWCLAWDSERRCRKALTAENRSRPEPEIFLEHYVKFSKLLWALVHSAFGKVFEIANKNRIPGGPVEWTRQQLTFMLEDKLHLSGEDCRARDWIVYACDGHYLTDWPNVEHDKVTKELLPVRSFEWTERTPVRDAWSAPVWLRAYPYNPETAWSRETEERSRRILDDKSYLLVGVIRRKLKSLAEEEHFRRAVTPITLDDTAETATGVEMRDKPFKLPPRQGRDRLLEESEGALTEKQYRALDLKVNFKLTDTDIGRAMGISRQAAAKFVTAATKNMSNFLENRKVRLREPRKGQK